MVFILSIDHQPKSPLIRLEHNAHKHDACVFDARFIDLETRIGHIQMKLSNNVVFHSPEMNPTWSYECELMAWQWRSYINRISKQGWSVVVVDFVMK